MTPSAWTTRADVVGTLRKRWLRGELLTALAQGHPVVPQLVPLRGPSAREVADRFGDVQDWVRRWEADAAGIRVEYTTVGGRLVGANRIPGRAWVDDEALLWRLLGVQAEVAAFGQLLARTEEVSASLAGWVREHPIKALAQAPVWDRLLAVTQWIVAHGGPTVYLRQIDVPGVDTKFIETHRRLLGELLDVVLPPERLQAAVPYGRFAERYRMALKPAFVRCRSLEGQPLTQFRVADRGVSSAAGAVGPTELTLRVDEAARGWLPGRRIIIVENEITYLALPAIPDSLAVLGGGYGVTVLAALTWLSEREVHYWGDLDTHGFAILDQLRAFLPDARSLLMDRTTVETHRDHWGREPSPATARLTRLTEPERTLYDDLVEDHFAPGLRLEQERIRFSAVRAAFAALG